MPQNSTVNVAPLQLYFSSVRFEFSCAMGNGELLPNIAAFWGHYFVKKSEGWLSCSKPQWRLILLRGISSEHIGPIDSSKRSQAKRDSGQAKVVVAVTFLHE
jgi:hypothetical protein